MTLLLNPNQNPIPVPGATLTQEGVVTLGQVASDTDIGIFVDSATGNDANPGTQALPVQTLAQALAILPNGIRAGANSNIIHLVNDGVTQEIYDIGNSVLNAGVPVGAQGTPLIIQSTPITTVDATETAGDINGLTITDAALTLTPNAEEGNFVRATSGANEGQRRMIRENGATTIEVNAPFPNAIGIGDTFQIEIPGAIIQYGDFDGSEFDFGPYPIGFIDIKLQPNSAYSNVNAFSASPMVAWKGCQWDAGGYEIALMNSNWQCAFIFNHLWGTAPGDPFNSLFNANFGDGLYINNAVMFIARSMLMGYIVVRNTFYDAESFGPGQCSQTLISPDFKDSFFNVGANSNCYIMGDAFFVPCRIGRFNNTPVTVAGQSFFDAGSFGANEFSNAPDDAVLVDTGAFANLANAIGTGSDAFGIHVQGMSQAQFNGSTTLTGSAGDTSVGGTPKTYAALGADGFTESNAGGSTLNRIAPVGL